MEKLEITEEQLQKSLADAVAKGTEASKAEVAELVAKLAEVQNEIKNLAASKIVQSSEEKHTEGMAKVGKFFRALMRDDKEEMKGLSEGVQADGGYLVHPEFVSGVMRVAEKFGIARQFCTMRKTSTTSVTFTTVGSGVSVSFIDEGTAITSSSPTFRPVTINVKKLAAFVSMTQEVLDDADADLAKVVAELVAEALAAEEDAQLFNGTGAPFTGVIEHADTIKVAGPVTADKIIDLKNAVKSKYKAGYAPRFYLNQNTMGAVEKLKSTTGEPLFRGLNEGDKGFLVGYPVTISDTLPDDTIVFGDLKFVGFAMRKDVSYDMGYADGDFQKDKKSLRAIERFGIEVLIPEAISVLA